MQFKKIHFIFLIILLPIFYSLAYKLELGIPGTDQKEFDLVSYITTLFNFSLKIIGFLAFRVLVWSGILWIFSAGSSEAKEKAKGYIQGALLGLTLILDSVLLLNQINPQILKTNLDGLTPIADKKCAGELEGICLNRSQKCQKVEDEYKCVENPSGGDSPRPEDTFICRSDKIIYNTRSECQNSCATDSTFSLNGCYRIPGTKEN
jgi:hypothetical protein